MFVTDSQHCDRLFYEFKAVILNWEVFVVAVVAVLLFLLINSFEQKLKEKKDAIFMPTIF